MSDYGELVIMGSGELADSMAEVHRALLAAHPDPRPVFLNSPAGFELNLENINHKAAAYFERNFGLALAVADFPGPQGTPAQIAAALTTIRTGNYLFAGPGSPSYALRVWRNSPVFAAVLERWREGATLIFSSAAALTLGAHTIPVYEIYKVGADVHWLPGLDVLGELGLPAAVVPHWNNRSGDQHDTRFCFMGAPRLRQLEMLLPSEALLIGVDEYTAARIRPAAGSGDVLGVGTVAIHAHGAAHAFSRGETFTLDTWRGLNVAAAAMPEIDGGLDPDAPAADTAPVSAIDDITPLRDRADQALRAGDFADAVEALVGLSLITQAGLEQGVHDRADCAAQALATLLPRLAQLKPKPVEDHATALMDLMLTMRAHLRAAKQWALADQLRDGLTALGYRINDTPDGATWQRSG
ncbi:MAG: hypothetical protein JNL73_09910 [Anaerolineales bacterium]|nr:hypothetical protein [Anaerolineales bacterium]